MSEESNGDLRSQGVWASLKPKLLGGAKDLRDPNLHHQLSLIAFLAWVGIGADGLSSSAYGPEEAYRELGQHHYLAFWLMLATAFTVLVISLCYSKIIEKFPEGGGGYLVASELLGKPVGVIAGSALLIDYILTITVSIASGGDAVFSLLPASLHALKMPTEFVAIALLLLLNLRGIKESITVLVPIFMVFLISHILLLGGGILGHLSGVGAVVTEVSEGTSNGIKEIGAWGLFAVFLRAYSMGGGTYTGIEAVSNAMSALREPKVATGKRTMIYMAISLAVTAGGLLLCYMLMNVQHVQGKTMNAVLANEVAGHIQWGGFAVGKWFVLITIGSEALLLLVAAQAGFIGGPGIMANMATDSWLPRRFVALSDRLTMQNGIILMGCAAMTLLAYTGGNIRILVIMYSINVFVTFTLAQAGMLRLWLRERSEGKVWKRNFAIHVVGFTLCFSILIVMIVEKFNKGAWVTVIITSALIAVCFAIRRHYQNVQKRIIEVKQTFSDLPEMLEQGGSQSFLKMASSIRQTAIILVGGYDGLGIHLFLNVLRNFPNTFDKVVFVSIGSVDSAFLKDHHLVETVEKRTANTLERYVGLAKKLGLEADSAYRIGTDVAEEASELCLEIARKNPRSVVFAGELLFEKPAWFHRLLHNETAYAIQRRIRFAGLSMVVMPLLLHQQSSSLTEFNSPKPAA